jgi:hypothetical protein
LPVLQRPGETQDIHAFRQNIRVLLTVKTAEVLSTLENPTMIASATFICSILFFCFIPNVVFSRVVVCDDIVIRGQKVMLKAETRGRLFSKGGEIVSFFVSGNAIGKNLSGGDGVAYKAFVPKASGMLSIGVTSGEDKAEGLVLSLEKGQGIVFVDIEGALLEKGLSMESRPGGQEAIAAISAKLPVVLLQTSIVGRSILKRWLKDNDFPELPVLSWRKGVVFEETVEKDLKLKAIIASPKVIESARKFDPMAFSFEQTDNAQEVDDWSKIAKALE